jgi:hypothetical protein
MLEKSKKIVFDAKKGAKKDIMDAINVSVLIGDN